MEEGNHKFEFYQPDHASTGSTEYEFHEIISDMFSYSLSIDKLHIAFYFFRTYKEDVFLNKEASIDTIIQTFED